MGCTSIHATLDPKLWRGARNRAADFFTKCGDPKPEQRSNVLWQVRQAARPEVLHAQRLVRYPDEHH